MMSLISNRKFATAGQCLIMLLCIGVLLSACHHPVKENAGQKARLLKPVDKATLLSMVTDVAKTLSKKGTTVNDATKALNVYAPTYAFSINGKPKHRPDSSFLYVYIQPTDVVIYVVFDVPASLKKAITFADLKNNFGEYTVGPLPKEVIDFDAMFFHVKDAPGISVNADSKKFPGKADNSILRMTIMRLEGGR